MTNTLRQHRMTAFKAVLSLALALVSSFSIYLAVGNHQLLPDEEIERYVLGVGALAWLLGLLLAVLGLKTIRPRTDHSVTGLSTFLNMLGLLLSILVLVLAVLQFFVLSIERVKTASVRIQNHNNLKQIALAMHNYADDHDGAFPPPAIYDAEGNPLLSWRVLLLPYLEQEELYRQFRLNEPWDSPNNLPLLKQMPKVYAHPNRDRRRLPHTTNYFVLVGDGAAFEDRRSVGLADFPDGLDETFLIVEAKPSVPWTKPDDLPFSSERALPPLGGVLATGFNAAFADGSVRSLRKEVSERTLRALITRNGKDKPENDW